MPVTVVLASSHAPTRTGVHHALEELGLEIRGEAADGAGAVDMVAEQRPDCCLIDVALDGGGMAAAAEIAAGDSPTAVVMLADDPSEEELFTALHTGASGYLAKDVDPGRLAHALVDACAGIPAIPRSLLAGVVDAFRARADGGYLPPDLERKLSRREREVLEALENDEPTARVAARLSISPVTVRRHVSSITDKLGVPDRGAALELLAAVRAASSERRPQTRAGDSGRSN